LGIHRGRSIAQTRYELWGSTGDVASRKMIYELWGSIGDEASRKRLPINQKLRYFLSTNQNLRLSLNQSEDFFDSQSVNQSTKIDFVSIRS